MLDKIEKGLAEWREALTHELGDQGLHKKPLRIILHMTVK